MNISFRLDGQDIISLAEGLVLYRGKDGEPLGAGPNSPRTHPVEIIMAEPDRVAIRSLMRMDRNDAFVNADQAIQSIEATYNGIADVTVTFDAKRDLIINGTPNSIRALLKAIERKLDEVHQQRSQDLHG